jgi:hypothetical protein
LIWLERETVLDSAGAVIANTNAAALQPEADPSGIDPVKIAAFLKLHQTPISKAECGLFHLMAAINPNIKIILDNDEVLRHNDEQLRHI